MKGDCLLFRGQKLSSFQCDGDRQYICVNDTGKYWCGNGSVTYRNAEEGCGEMGGHLWPPVDNQEIVEMWNLTCVDNDGAWTNDRRIWRLDTTGEEVHFRDWNVPDHKNESTLCVIYTNQTFLKTPCTSTHAYICQREDNKTKNKWRMQQSPTRHSSFLEYILVATGACFLLSFLGGIILALGLPKRKNKTYYNVDPDLDTVPCQTHTDRLGVGSFLEYENSETKCFVCNKEDDHSPNLHAPIVSPYGLNNELGVEVDSSYQNVCFDSNTTNGQRSLTHSREVLVDDTVTPLGYTGSSMEALPPPPMELLEEQATKPEEPVPPSILMQQFADNFSTGSNTSEFESAFL